MKHFGATDTEMSQLATGVNTLHFVKFNGVCTVVVGDHVQFSNNGDIGPIDRIVEVVHTSDTMPALKKGWIAFTTRRMHRAEQPERPERLVPVRVPTMDEHNAYAAGQTAKAAGMSRWATGFRGYLKQAWLKGYNGNPLV